MPEALVDWLNAVIAAQDLDETVFTHVEDVEIREVPEGVVLEGRARGVPMPLAASSRATEVKAVTYQGLYVRQVGETWEARIVVDV